MTSATTELASMPSLGFNLGEEDNIHISDQESVLQPRATKSTISMPKERPELIPLETEKLAGQEPLVVHKTYIWEVIIVIVSSLLAASMAGLGLYSIKLPLVMFSKDDEHGVTVYRGVFAFAAAFAGWLISCGFACGIAAVVGRFCIYRGIQGHRWLVLPDTLRGRPTPESGWALFAVGLCVVTVYGVSHSASNVVLIPYQTYFNVTSVQTFSVAARHNVTGADLAAIETLTSFQGKVFHTLNGVSPSDLRSIPLPGSEGKPLLLDTYLIVNWPLVRVDCRSPNVTCQTATQDCNATLAWEYAVAHYASNASLVVGRKSGIRDHEEYKVPLASLNLSASPVALQLECNLSSSPPSFLETLISIAAFQNTGTIDRMPDRQVVVNDWRDAASKEPGQVLEKIIMWAIFVRESQKWYCVSLAVIAVLNLLLGLSVVCRPMLDVSSGASIARSAMRSPHLHEVVLSKKEEEEATWTGKLLTAVSRKPDRAAPWDPSERSRSGAESSLSLASSNTVGDQAQQRFRWKMGPDGLPRFMPPSRPPSPEMGQR